MLAIRPGAHRCAHEVFSECGHTLLEVLMSATILVVMVLLVTTLTLSGTEAQNYANRLTQTTEITQEIVDDMRRELVSSVVVFHGDALGKAYEALLDFSTTAVPISHVLPKLDAKGIFEKDSNSLAAKTGNALLFARHAFSTTFRTTSGKTHRIDVYRLVHYYPTKQAGGPAPGSPLGLDLVKWVSEPLADGQQIDKITASVERTEVLGHLLNSTPDVNGKVHPAVEVVWMRGGDPALPKTLRQIQSSGGLTDNPQAPRSSPWQILADERATANGLLFRRHQSVATNFSPPTYGISRFGILNLTGDGFPHGFEVQVIGPASARQILLRLMVVSSQAKGLKAHSAILAIVAARDL